MPASTRKIIALAREYPSRYGAPIISAVDRDIFRLTYFTHCSSCDFCFDACCHHGVDVDVENMRRILAQGEPLEHYVGRPAGDWFEDGVEPDGEFPGGASTRTRVYGGGCVFLRPHGRGCLLHSYSLERGLDYHDLKPLVSALFPLTFEDGVLCPATEVEDGSLVCLTNGPTLYQGMKDELRYYFGAGLVTELDGLKRATPADTPRGTS